MRNRWHPFPGPKFYCPVCGRVKRKTDTKVRYDGVTVCIPCWNPQHPQELVKPAPFDDISVQDARVDPEHESYNYYTVDSDTGIVTGDA